jgi:hypothetical protein
MCGMVKNLIGGNRHCRFFLLITLVEFVSDGDLRPPDLSYFSALCLQAWRGLVVGRGGRSEEFVESG